MFTKVGSLLLLLWLALPLCAQEQAEQLRVIHSDKLTLTTQQEEKVLNLNGAVHFWYGKTEFFCDKAVIFREQKIARLDGNVVVNNDSLLLKSNSLVYYRNAEELQAAGNVYVQELRKTGSFRWMRSDFATFNKQKNELTVWDNVSSFDKEENAWATCGYIFWDRGVGVATLTEDPEIRAGTPDTLHVTANMIKLYDKEEKLEATYNVVVTTRDYRATSDFLIYINQDNKAVFTGQPRFRSDFAEAVAREFYLHLEDRKLTRAELVDSCLVEFSEEANGPKTNWVRASYINLDFDAENISKFQAEKSVSYNYLQEERAERDFFINTASGDYLEAEFGADNKLEFMKMRTGINGIYKFRGDS